jgi:hypothetical protein
MVSLDSVDNGNVQQLFLNFKTVSPTVLGSYSGLLEEKGPKHLKARKFHLTERRAPTPWSPLRGQSRVDGSCTPLRLCPSAVYCYKRGAAEPSLAPPYTVVRRSVAVR